MKLKVILTGATGMVGEGVLLECLHNPAVEHILVLGRKATGRSHPKVTEVLVPDFQNLSAVQSQLTGFNACFFCAGISSVGISKAEYERVTHDLTLAVGQTLAHQNPDMTFIYVTGAGTDSTGKSRSHWARVKGRTENELLGLPFHRAYMFRPGFMRPQAGQKNVPRLMGLVNLVYPVVRRLAPSYACTLQEVARAMIAAANTGAPKTIMEVPDIVALAHGRRSVVA
jgi:uncharacterized protein YbjT (DUF2867 family)